MKANHARKQQQTKQSDAKQNKAKQGKEKHCKALQTKPTRSQRDPVDAANVHKTTRAHATRKLSPRAQENQWLVPWHAACR